MVCNEKWKVDAKFDDVADILPGKENVHIKVRVLRLRKFPAFLNPCEFSSLEMVLVDEKAGKIHASIRKHVIYMFESKLEKGQVYEMSYFSIFPQSGSYGTTLHPYKLVFQIKINLKLSESSDITQLSHSIVLLI
ncbi:replication protein A 70 kDa DNA-binding subunit [Trifolium repens]|nr:replication protein A 70 kDa DNA-binding subunit [Trifolium repens]